MLRLVFVTLLVWLPASAPRGAEFAQPCEDLLATPRPSATEAARLHAAVRGDAAMASAEMRQLFANAQAAKELVNQARPGSLNDPQRVRQLLREAAALGDLEAKLILAEALLARGTLVALNEAAFWFRKAAEAGSVEAHRNVADIVELGIGGPKDTERAERHRRLWFEAVPRGRSFGRILEPHPNARDASQMLLSVKTLPWHDLFLLPHAVASGWIPEAHAIAHFAADVRREGDRLYLRTSDGGEVILENLDWSDFEDASAIKDEKRPAIEDQLKQFGGDPFPTVFRFQSYLRQFGFYLISYAANFHDGGTIFVDRKRGCWHDLPGIVEVPRFNPSARDLAFVSAADAHHFNGIEIWSVGLGTLRLDFRFIPAFGMHRFLEWVDDDTLRVAAFITSRDGDLEHVFHIRRGDGIWFIRDHPLRFPLIDCSATDLDYETGIQCHFRR